MKDRLNILFKKGFILVALFCATNLFAQVPTITSFTPTTGVLGTTLTITGTNFNTTSANNVVYFGATQAAVTAATATSLTVTVPAGASYAPITVLNSETSLLAQSAVKFIPTYAGTKGTSYIASDFASAVTTDLSTNYQSLGIKLGDVDGDGKADLITSNPFVTPNKQISIVRNTSTSGSISFATKLGFNVGNTGTSPTSSAEFGDLDGDGKPDIVVCDNGSTTISVFRNISTSGSISLATRQTFATPASSTPNSVSLGDFNADGKLDVAVANRGSGNISVFLNTSVNGTISLGTRLDISTGTNPYYGISSVDFDGDGNLDIAVLNRGSSTISVLRNTSSVSSISFATKVDFTIAATNGYRLSVGDIDGDGKPDLAVCYETGTTLSLFRNTSPSGSITMNNRQDITTLTNARNITLGDVNGDSKIDMVVGCFSGNAGLHLNTSTSGTISFGNVVTISTGAYPDAGELGDIDGDGKPDIVQPNSGGYAIYILRNNPQNTDLSALTISSGSLSPIFASGTISYTTAAVSNATTSVTVTPTKVDANSTIQVRVNGGTYATVTSGSTSASLSLNVGSNTVDTRVTGPNGTTNKIYTITVTRLSSNADLSALTTAAGTISPSFAAATISYKVAVINTTTSVTVTPTKSDANATIQVRINNGTYATVNSGSASSALALNIGNNPIDIQVTAQDGTIKTYSLLVTRLAIPPTITSFTPTSGNVGTSVTINGTNFSSTTTDNIVYFGATRATVSAATSSSLTVTVPAGATFGNLRVTNSNLSLTAVSLSKFIPTYTLVKQSYSSIDFSSSQSFATNSSNSSVVQNKTSIGDIDNDGKPDVVVANNAGTTISILRNTGSAGAISFATKVDFTVGSNPNSAGLGDIDGDGLLDIVVSARGSNTITVLINTSTSGAVSFASPITITSANLTYDADLADFDGDGKLDLIYTRGSSNLLEVRLNTSTGLGVSNVSFRSVATQLTGGNGNFSTGFGDLDGDGKVDVVAALANVNAVNIWRNTSTVNSLSFVKNSPDLSFSSVSYDFDLADFDGDGKLDLAFANNGSANVVVFRNTSTSGTISFATAQNFSSSACYGLSVADINGDGKLDIATSVSSILLNSSTSGTISFTTSFNLTGTSNPLSNAMSDLDGDGKPDIVVSNSNSTISVYRNNPLSTNADLTSLAATIGELTPIFASATTAYTATVSNATTSVTVTPTKSDANATIQARVNSGTYTTVISGSSSSSLSLNVGSNIIDVKVTAQDGTTTKTYTITITRESLLTWIGATSNTWNLATNWNPSQIPINADDVVIATSSNNPVLSNTNAVKNITINSGATLTVIGILQIGGNLSTSGTLNVSDGGLSFNGSSAQTANVNGGTVQNVIINNSAGVTLSGALNVTGVLSPLAGTLTTGGNLTLKSNALGTASIAASTGTISGNVTVERYLTNRAARGGWRFLSSPVQGQTVSNWMTQFYVTGPGDGTTLGAPNTNGWHTNQANIDFPTSGNDYRRVLTTSIRTYNESTSGSLDLGWSNLTSPSQSLTVGQGFRAYIRGPISGGTGQLGPNANSNVQATVTLSLTGAVNSGDITMPVSATATGAGSTFDGTNDGWNLLGNPYPCAYDWNSASTVKTNIATTIHVFDATANGYKSYNSASGGTLTGGIIPSGAAFFVQATNTGAALTFKEAGKITSTPPIAVHKGAKTDEFTIKYSKDTVENDEFVVKMIAGSTLNKDGYDISKLRNENLNIGSYGTDTMPLALSAIPFVDGETRIKLNVEATQVGTYKFEFKNIENFDAGVSVSLLDKYTNKTTSIKANTVYSFEMGAGENQWGKNRFELILNGKATGVNNTNAAEQEAQMLVYPNPATDVLNIDINNANFKNSEIVIYNISGTEVLRSNMASNSAQLNIETLSAGVYFVKVSNPNGFNKTVKFVK